MNKLTLAVAALVIGLGTASATAMPVDNLAGVGTGLKVDQVRIVCNAWGAAGGVQIITTVPMATMGAAVITTTTVSTSVRGNIRISSEATDVQGGGLLPPTALWRLNPL